MFVLCAMFATVALAETATTQPAKAAKAAKAPTTLIKGYYAMMASEVELTEAQRAQLEGVLAERQTELVAFQKENDGALKALDEKLKAAKAAEDKDAANAVSAEIRKINSGKAPIEEKYKPRIASILTPEQASKLDAYHFYIGVASHYSKAKLTDDQKAALRKVTDGYAAEAKKIGDDKKARGEFLKTVYAEGDKLLTEEQLAAMKAPKK